MSLCIYLAVRHSSNSLRKPECEGFGLGLGFWLSTKQTWLNILKATCSDSGYLHGNVSWVGISSLHCSISTEPRTNCLYRCIHFTMCKSMTRIYSIGRYGLPWNKQTNKQTIGQSEKYSTLCGCLSKTNNQRPILCSPTSPQRRLMVESIVQGIEVNS